MCGECVRQWPTELIESQQCIFQLRQQDEEAWDGALDGIACEVQLLKT